MLGLWIEQTEGAKFWLKVMNELQARGLQDILTAVQTCIVHLIRNSPAFVSWKDRKKVIPDLKTVYRPRRPRPRRPGSTSSKPAGGHFPLFWPFPSTPR